MLLSLWLTEALTVAASSCRDELPRLAEGDATEGVDLAQMGIGQRRT
ncbi:hypothetical protein [Micromonospora sp. WMMD1155]|nr:hypothetical protein [Micromonospora sp. WMMD1155]WFE53124.1 hypothetical protein O7617_23645 [Micromonospora sp. WMMD1155]